MEALADAARVAPLALVNVVDNRSGGDVRTVAAGLATAYPHVWALAGRGGNTVVVAGVAKLNLERIGAQAAADRSPARLTPPQAMARVAGTTPPLRDETIGEI